MKHAINWFEIPVENYERAKQFYATVTNSEITDHHMPEQNTKYGVFTHGDKDSVGGAIIEAENQIPSNQGATVYLNSGDDLSVPLSKVENAGGKIIMPKTAIGKDGYIAQFIDSEGNKVAFHSWN